jgi:hypothetical protein
MSKNSKEAVLELIDVNYGKLAPSILDSWPIYPFKFLTNVITFQSSSFKWGVRVRSRGQAWVFYVGI